MTRAWVLAIASALMACAGEQAPERRCTAHSQCDDGFLCGPDGLCTPSQACASDGECCPGAVCFSGWCRPTSECGPDRACAGLGEVCENEQCVPAACDALSGCPEPFVCVGGVGGRCLLGPPCGGGCPDGAACDLASDRCATLAEPCRCEAGFATVIGASDGLSCERSCSCAPLPAVPPGRPGVWGGLLSDLRTVVGYEPEYGDLVGSRFEVPAELSEPGQAREGVVVDRADQALDGLPESGPVLSDDAYRGGRLDPGPDLGDRPVLLEEGELVHAFYRDHDTNRLRYGRFGRAPGEVALGLETSHPLPVFGVAVAAPAEGPEGPDLGVGRFSCLVPRPGGGGNGLGGLVFVGADPSDSASLLVRVESRVERPTSESDWVATTVLETPLPPREDDPCGGACGLTEACVVAPSGAHACAGLVGLGGGEPCECGAREVCGEVEGLRRCHPRVERRAGPDRLPYGEGLFVSCAATPSGVAAVWYDADLRRLVAARWPFGPESREVVDTGTRRDPGHFAHLMARGDALTVAYQDAATGELRVGRQAGPGRPWATTIVPAGPGEHGLWVRGVDTGGGLVLVAGEGGTRDILLFSLTDARGCWASRRALTSGGYAYPDVRVDGAGGASVWISAQSLILDEQLVPRHGPVLARVALPTACP